MRGHAREFYRIEKNTPATFFLVSPPHKYEAHYVGEPRSKKNCHGIACPFCLDGIKVSAGLYVIVLDERGQLFYLDITQSLYSAMSTSAKEYCVRHGERFTDMGNFLAKMAVTILKESDDRGLLKYGVSYRPVTPEKIEKITSRIANADSKIGSRHRELVAGFYDLTRPGTVREDTEVVYVV